jgi:hypothetical protein
MVRCIISPFSTHGEKGQSKLLLNIVLMYSLWIHLVAFFQVVVLNCVQPANWKYCYRVDQWLIPDVVEGYQLWSGQKKIYQNEKDYLNSLDDSIE